MVCLYWFSLIFIFFATLFTLFTVYVRGFARHDMWKIDIFYYTIVLACSITFFSIFSSFRINSRFHRLKKKRSEKPDFDDTFTTLLSGKKNAKYVLITLVLTIAFMVLNFVLGWFAYNNNDNLKFFFHMVIVIVTVLVSNTFTSALEINECFTQFEKIISKSRKQQNAEEKSE
jgi:hypothetical protein